MKHTPTPWKVVMPSGGNNQMPHICVMAAGLPVVIAKVCGDPRQDNAAFIVKACNMHDELVAALEESFIYVTPEHWEEKSAWIKKAGALLERVKQ